jgi:YhcH/YjgK/YiaL family protein
MILDRIDNAARYSALGDRFVQSFELLNSGRLGEKEAGKYEADGKQLYYLIERYTTEPVGVRRLESHRRYADIQVVLAGREIMGYARDGDLEVAVPYDANRDIAFFRTPAHYTELKLSAGEFVVLLPGEAHVAHIQSGAAVPVVKVVFKVLMDS